MVSTKPGMRFRVSVCVPPFRLRNRRCLCGELSRLHPPEPDQILLSRLPTDPGRKQVARSPLSPTPTLKTRFCYLSRLPPAHFMNLLSRMISLSAEYHSSCHLPVDILQR